jgi:hypothetical protein
MRDGSPDPIVGRPSLDVCLPKPPTDETRSGPRWGGIAGSCSQGLPKQSPTQAPHESSLSSGRAWARNRISSTITEHMVMALRHDRARFGCERLGPRPSV